MNRGFNVISVIAQILTILGALNWLLLGIFDFNFVSWITGSWIWLERAIYILIGLSGLYTLAWLIVRRFDMVSINGDKDYYR